MSNVLGALWNLIKKIFSKIFKWLAEIFGDWLLIILIIVAIYFAPVIAAWLASVGAPAFMVSFFEVLALATPYVTAVVDWVIGTGGSLLSAVWDGYKGLDIGTQAAIALGAAAMIAPEETATLIEESGELLSEVVSAAAGAVFSSPWTLALAAGAVWWFFLRKKEQPVVVLQNDSGYTYDDSGVYGPEQPALGGGNG